MNKIWCHLQFPFKPGVSGFGTLLDKQRQFASPLPVESLPLHTWQLSLISKSLDWL